MLERFRKCYKGRSILAFSADFEDRLTAVQRIFDLAWKLGVIDIVVVTNASQNCNVYTYFPYQEQGKCIDTQPVLLVSWNESLHTDVDFFPETKISNLRSCKLVFEVSVIGKSVRKYNDFWRPLVSFLLRAMNASGEVLLDVKPEFPLITGNSTNVLMGKFLVTPQRLSAFVIPTCVVTSREYLAVPCEHYSGVQWFRIVDELLPSVWFGVAISFLISLATFYIIMKSQHDLGYIVLFGLQSLLNVPCRHHRLSWHGKLYFISFVYFSFVLSQTYFSKLLLQLTFSFERETIDSIEDLAASEVLLHVHASMRDHMLQILALNPNLGLLKNKIRFVHKNYLEVVDRSRQDLAYFTALDFFEDFFSNLSYHILPDAGYDTLRTFVLLPKFSPYEKLVNKAILQTYGAGCFAFVARRESNSFLSNSRRASATRADALSLDSLLAVFVLWFIGCIVSFVSFSFEVFSSQFHNRVM